MTLNQEVTIKYFFKDLEYYYNNDFNRFCKMAQFVEPEELEEIKQGKEPTEKQYLKIVTYLNTRHRYKYPPDSGYMLLTPSTVTIYKDEYMPLKVLYSMYMLILGFQYNSHYKDVWIVEPNKHKHKMKDSEDLLSYQEIESLTEEEKEYMAPWLYIKKTNKIIASADLYKVLGVKDELGESCAAQGYRIGGGDYFFDMPDREPEVLAAFNKYMGKEVFIPDSFARTLESWGIPVNVIHINSWDELSGIEIREE